MDDEALPFFVRVQEQAVESYTMKEVFSMESSVRIEAIENLGNDTSSYIYMFRVLCFTERANNY